MNVKSEIQKLVKEGRYVFSKHAHMRSCETDRPSQSEVIDILKSGWHDKSYDEQDADGTYRYRITGHALTGRKGSAVVTFAELKSGRRLLIITVF